MQIQSQIGNSWALLVSQIDAWRAPIPGKFIYRRDDWVGGRLDGPINVSLKL